MSVARTRGAVCAGVHGQVVDVQVHVSNGLPRVAIVGLADASVNEARDRVRSALVNSGFGWPDRRITIGLSPASEHKRGATLDLAIAVGLLAAQDVLPTDRAHEGVFVGELGLDGSIRGVPGGIAMGRAVGSGTAYVPAQDGHRWALVPGLRVVPVHSLRQLVAVLIGTEETPRTPEPVAIHDLDLDLDLDLSDVLGQGPGCRAVEVAAAGGHHLLLRGRPGVGKTMLAKRVASLLPPLPADVMVELAAVQEAAGTAAAVSAQPPLQAPHHTASHAAVVGSAHGSIVRPGLISLAHGGVLLLDEAPEFRRETLEALRQPLEDGSIRVARAGVVADLPARFQLIMTANPCPCGEADVPDGDCRCSSLVRRRYTNRLSGPLLDRVDLTVQVGAPTDRVPGPTSAQGRDRVRAARDRARIRLRDVGASVNAAVSARDLRKRWPLPQRSASFLAAEEARNGHSSRAIDKVCRVAWTIADLAGRDEPGIEDVAMALGYRGAVR